MRYKQVENLPWRKIEGRAVIISPKSGQVHELDDVGSLLWTMADGVKSIEEVASKVVEDFEVEPLVAVQDAQEFYKSLETLGLVTCQS